MMSDGNAYPYIGFDKLFVAELVSDDENGAFYGEIRQLPGAVSASVEPKSEVDNFYADDGVYAQVTSSVVTEIKLTVANISNANYAWLLGASYDASTGQLIESSKDVPKTVALGYRAQLANGAHDYVWRMAGVFSKPKKSYHTKEDKIKYTHNELVFNARPLTSGQLVNAFSSGDAVMDVLGLSESFLSSEDKGFFSTPLFVASGLGNGIDDLIASTPNEETVEDGDLELTFSAAVGASQVMVQVKDLNGAWVKVDVVDDLEASSTSAQIRHSPTLMSGNLFEVRLVVIGGDHAGASNVAIGRSAMV